jgi:protein TonB
MTRTVTLFQFMPYGAPELQSVARPYMVRALLVSATLSTMLFAAFGVLQPLLVRTSAPPPLTPIIWRHDMVPAPPPLLNVAPVRPVSPTAPSAAISGVPVPKPDAQVPVDRTIPTQQDLRGSTPGAGEGAGERPLIVEPPAAEALPDFGTYTYREQEPAPVTMVRPEYPAMAKEAGVSGLVMVAVLVGKNGHVLDARIEPSHSILMLNDAALEAARKWVFTPALANQKPVAVWVAVPFHFTLQ